MQIIDIQCQRFFVFHEITWCEDNRHLDLLVFLLFVIGIEREKHLALFELEVQVGVLLEVGLDGDCGVIAIGHFEEDGLWKRLFHHERGSEIIGIEGQINQWFS